MKTRSLVVSRWSFAGWYSIAASSSSPDSILPTNMANPGLVGPQAATELRLAWTAGAAVPTRALATNDWL
jgi:hypothetical protein